MIRGWVPDQQFLHRLGVVSEIDWSRAVVDRRGVPLTCLISAANTHDSQLLIPLLDSVTSVQAAPGRPRRRPAKLHADTTRKAEHFQAFADLACALLANRRLLKATN